MALILHGFRYSVYVRIARIALAEKGLTYEQVEIDPFATDVPIEYLTLHPFKRVPVLVDGDFVLYETEAITRYIDEAFHGPTLQPAEPRQRARMAQIISIIDSYGYVPMVRQVAGGRVFARFRGRKPDEALIRTGLQRSSPCPRCARSDYSRRQPNCWRQGLVARRFPLSAHDGLFYSSPGRRRSLSPLHQTFRMVAGYTRAEES
jgi:hypothetical protein